MKNRSAIVLKSLLNRCPPERKASLSRFLSPEESERLNSTPSFQVLDGFDADMSFEGIHWSWFLPTLKTYPLKERKLFLSALGPTFGKSLAKELGVSSWPKEEPTAIGAQFLKQVLLSSLVGHRMQVLPPSCVPDSKLKFLLSLKKTELVRLIDFLSLHDLAAELRQIVETKILKKIYSFLTEGEKAFLKDAIQKKEPYPVPRLGLEKWDGEKESFRYMLHKRGLARLGAALSGQDPDLAWHICHQLDIGRGGALLKLTSKEAPKEVSDEIAGQILELRSKG
jgi:hypothetical protein